VLAAETDKNLSVKEKSFSKIGFRKKQKQFCCANNYKNVYCKIAEKCIILLKFIIYCCSQWILHSAYGYVTYVTIAADNINFKLFFTNQFGSVHTVKCDRCIEA
jgi:hypothetical protein